MRIAIVDDDSALRESLKFLLHGHDVTVFGDAKKFLDGPDGYDVLILDYSMPVMNGESALREMARRGIKIPTIAISGNGTMRMTMLKLGAICFLEKPLCEEEITSALASIPRNP